MTDTKTAPAKRKTIPFSTFDRVSEIARNNLHPTCEQADLLALLSVCSANDLVDEDPDPVLPISRAARKELEDAEERGRQKALAEMRQAEKQKTAPKKDKA